MGKKYRTGRGDEEERPGGQGGQEDLNEYIRITGPGTFAVILSLLILLVSMTVWGFVGTLPVTETVTGLVIDTAAYVRLNPAAEELLSGDEAETLVLCFVDASRYNGQAIKEFGDKAKFGMPDQSTFTGTITTRFREPISMEKAKSILLDNEWVLGKCVSQDYNWLIVVCPDEDLSRYAFTLADVTLLTEEVPPIRFLMK